MITEDWCRHRFGLNSKELIANVNKDLRHVSWQNIMFEELSDEFGRAQRQRGELFSLFKLRESDRYHEIRQLHVALYRNLRIFRRHKPR